MSLNFAAFVYCSHSISGFLQVDPPTTPTHTPPPPPPSRVLHHRTFFGNSFLIGIACLRKQRVLTVNPIQRPRVTGNTGMLGFILDCMFWEKWHICTVSLGSAVDPLDCHKPNSLNFSLHPPWPWYSAGRDVSSCRGLPQNSILV